MIQKICDIDPEVIAKAKKFRMRKEQNIAALICKYYDRYLLHFQSSHCTWPLQNQNESDYWANRSEAPARESH